MLKRLAILVILFAFAQIPLPMKGENRQNQAQDRTSKADLDAQAAATAEVNEETAANAERYAYYRTHPKEYLKAAVAPANLSNWVLAALGIVGGIVALCTLFAIKKQAHHTVTSERAWLIIKSDMEGYRPTEGEKPVFRWSIRNTGQTVARAIETVCVYEFVTTEFLEKLPAEPDYSLPIELNGLPVPPGDFLHYAVNLIQPPQSSAMEALSHGDVAVIRLRSHWLIAYGRVKYFDAFGNERESRFCERYIWPEDGKINTGFQPFLDVPRAYAKYS